MPDCTPVKGGVLRSFLKAAGEVKEFLARFFALDLGFGTLSDPDN
jgi:hypothetical protein